MIFEFIDTHYQEFKVSRMCQMLDVSRSGYYAWRDRGPSQRQQEDERLTVLITTIFEQSRKTYGSPRVQADLCKQGVRCSRRRVARLMKQADLVARPRRKRRPVTTTPGAGPFAPNVLDRDFSAGRPHQKWVTDLTYIDTAQGWLYLAVILDLYSRQVVGWALADHMRDELTQAAFNGDGPLSTDRPAASPLGPGQPIYQS